MSKQIGIDTEIPENDFYKTDELRELRLGLRVESNPPAMFTDYDITRRKKQSCILRISRNRGNTEAS